MKSRSCPPRPRLRTAVTAVTEHLESRTFLSATVGGTISIVNASKLIGPQNEESIAINPTNPAELFIASNNPGNSLFTARSTDGGATWTKAVRFTGGDGFPEAAIVANPSVAWDKFGNLFVAYDRGDNSSVEVLNSFDSGQTFHVLANLKGIDGKPSLAVGDGMMWVGFNQQAQAGAPAPLASGGAVAYGAQVTGLGRFKRISSTQVLTTVDSTVRDMAIGPAGQVTAAYVFVSGSGPSQIFTATDLDGLGPKRFGTPGTVTTQVGFGEIVPAQTNAGIDQGASLAYDLSGDAFTGRLYLAYVDAPSGSSAATSIYLRTSNDYGATWSAPTKVNDDNTNNTHFNPKVAVDPTTGAVAVTWYDCRNDNGIPGAGGTNNTPNDDVQVYGALGTPIAGGVSFSPNYIVQPAFSNANDVLSSVGIPGPSQFPQLGRYNGLAFYGGQLYPAWADNSNSTGDNADGPLAQPDVYVAKVPVQASVTSAGTLIGAFGNSGKRFAFTSADGTHVTFQLRGGTGYVFQNGSALAVRVNGTDAKSTLVINAHGGSGAFNLSNLIVSGSIGTIRMPRGTLAGTFAVLGNADRVILGDITGGTFIATGAIGKMKVRSLTNARVLSGANPGPDGAFAGPSDTDDSFGAGSIDQLIVAGAIQSSVIGAGVNPVDGVFGNGNDTIITPASSRIGLIRAHSADAASRFEAGVFGPVLLPGPASPTTDPRFVTH